MAGRREQIVQAARGLAMEQGVSALSVRAVADRAGIGASTLRHYFPTQRALHDAVMQELFDAEVSDLRIEDRSLDPVTRLSTCMLQFLPTVEQGVAPLGAWLAMYAAALGPEGTAAQQQMLEVVEASARRRVRGWLAQLDREGVLRAGDPELHASTLLVVVDGLALGLLTPGSPLDADGVVAILRSVVAGCVVAGAGPTSG